MDNIDVTNNTETMKKSEKLLTITKLLNEVYTDLNDESKDFTEVFETITKDLRYYLIYETMDKQNQLINEIHEIY